jgi:hypothetical protein
LISTALFINSRTALTPGPKKKGKGKGKEEEDEDEDV